MLHCYLLTRQNGLFDHGLRSMIRVLGVDVASSKWIANGSALLAFESGAAHFSALRVPALVWPADIAKTLWAVGLADAIDRFARQEGVAAVALDGPQGWRDPETLEGTPGVGRRCEYECHTPAKTGVYPETYPGNQRPWVEFCTEVFAALLQRPSVRLASSNASGEIPSDGYVVLECFPTSVWRSSGLTPLPGKSRKPDLRSFADKLITAYRIPFQPAQVERHDDLQAIAAAVAAAAYAGGPAVPLPRGVPAVPFQSGNVQLLQEGLIWDAKPVDADASSAAPEVAAMADRVSLRSMEPCVRVTQSVLDQVGRAGRSHAQIALRSFPPRDEAVVVLHAVRSQIGDEAYPLTIGDSHAVWVTHQREETRAGFDRLFALLSDQPGTWMQVAIRPGKKPTYASPGDYLASHGRPTPDATWRTVSIPIRVVDGKIKTFGKTDLPELADCIGDLVVPAFAVKNTDDLEWLTRSHVRMLFDKDTTLLCRVSGRQIPRKLVKECRTEVVPNSGAPGAFVEVVLEEPLFLCFHGTKKATLGPTKCIVPTLSRMTVRSLNEAYRRISEKFEPGRMSAGGNVFRSCYYFDVERNQWRPIGELRGDVIFTHH